MLCHPTKQISINEKIICEENIKELNLKTISKSLLPKGIEESLENFLSSQCVCAQVIELMCLLKLYNGDIQRKCKTEILIINIKWFLSVFPPYIYMGKRLQIPPSDPGLAQFSKTKKGWIPLHLQVVSLLPKNYDFTGPLYINNLT